MYVMHITCEYMYMMLSVASCLLFVIMELLPALTEQLVVFT